MCVVSVVPEDPVNYSVAAAWAFVATEFNGHWPSLLLCKHLRNLYQSHLLPILARFQREGFKLDTHPTYAGALEA